MNYVTPGTKYAKVLVCTSQNNDAIPDRIMCQFEVRNPDTRNVVKCM